MSSFLTAFDADPLVRVDHVVIPGTCCALALAAVKSRLPSDGSQRPPSTLTPGQPRGADRGPARGSRSQPRTQVRRRPISSSPTTTIGIRRFCEQLSGNIHTRPPSPSSSSCCSSGHLRRSSGSNCACCAWPRTSRTAARWCRERPARSTHRPFVPPSQFVAARALFSSAVPGRRSPPSSRCADDTPLFAEGIFGGYGSPGRACSRSPTSPANAAGRPAVSAGSSRSSTTPGHNPRAGGTATGRAR